MGAEKACGGGNWELRKKALCDFLKHHLCSSPSHPSSFRSSSFAANQVCDCPWASHLIAELCFPHLGLKRMTINSCWDLSLRMKKVIKFTVCKAYDPLKMEWLLGLGLCSGICLTFSNSLKATCGRRILVKRPWSPTGKKPVVNYVVRYKWRFC